MQDTEIPLQVADDFLHVEVDRKFIILTGVTSPVSVSRNNIATYRLSTSRDNAAQLSRQISGTIQSITTKDFNKFSIPSGAYIRTFIKITGLKSGVQKIIEVRIS